MTKTVVIGKKIEGVTQLSRFMVLSGDKIVLLDAKTGLSPKKVTSKVIDKNLYIYEEGATDPSVILNDYKTFENSVQIQGIDQGGTYYDYAMGDSGTMALSSTPVVAPVAAHEPWLSTNAMLGIGILAAGGVALAAGGGGGDSTTAPAVVVNPLAPTATPPDTTSPIAPVITALAAGNIINSTENTNLVISGTGEIGATVTLATANQTAIVDSSGNWSMTIADATSTFGEGTKTLSVTQADIAGNVSVAATRVITIDTIASTPIINAVTDDNIVNSTENPGLVISGTGEIGAMVTLAVANQTTLVDGTGVWSFTVADTATTFGQDAELLSVTQTDVAGNVSSAGTRSIFIDTVAPIYVSGTANAGSDVITLNFDSVLDTVDFSSIGNFILTVGNVDHTDALYALSTSGSSLNIVLDTSKYNINMGDTVTIAYSDVSGDAAQAIQDLAGNDVISFGNMTLSILNVDTPPILTAMAPNSTNEQIVLTFNETLNASSSLLPALGDFGIEINGVAVANPTGVTITGANVTLQLGMNITLNDLIKVTYTDNASATNAIQDLLGNDALSFSYTNTAVI